MELDSFVRRMVGDKEFASKEQWKKLQAIAQAVTKLANRLGNRQFDVYDFTVPTMEHILCNAKTKNLGSVNRAIMLSAGSRHINTVTHSLVIVDGDLLSAGCRRSLPRVYAAFLSFWGVGRI